MPRSDLRMPALALVAWLTALVVVLVPGALTWWAVVAVGLGAAALAARRRSATLGAVVLLVAGVACSGLVRAHAVGHNPVADLALDGAQVRVVGEVVDDPRAVAGPFGEQVVLRLAVTDVVGRGIEHRLRTPVLVIGSTDWLDVPLGAEVRADGRLTPADDTDVAAVLLGSGVPVLLQGPGWAWRAAGAVRASIRASVAGRPPDQAALVAGLVDGDDAGLDPALVDDFKTTGLTHLTAVSGTNLTLVVGFLLALARWCGVRGRWLRVVAVLGIAGFLLLARTEPSVVRAAAMGTVGLMALGSNGRQQAVRGLGVATVVLLLLDPRLAVSAGFALSVLATAGIVLLAPGWRDAMSRWLPRSVAEAVAVPAAAQLACTPLVAAISGQVSLVAVVANLVVEPVVGPATVLGLAGGLVGLVVAPLGRVFGTVAAWCVAWIIWVARHAAAVPVAAVGWGSTGWSVVLLTVLVVVIALVGPWVLRRPAVALPMAGLMVLACLVRLPSPGWSGPWVLAMCDVGQGDALVLNAGGRSGVVVDAGPDPTLVDTCLRRLHVDSVPLLVLTHFHADHVDGLAGVLRGRQVGAVWTTTLLDPPGGVEEVADETAADGLAPVLPPFGQTVRVGDVSLQPVWPPSGPPVLGPGDGSTANEASIVMVVEAGGLRILMTGDVEPPGQEALAAALPGLHVDVLKVPHHGSRYQDLPWLASLDSSVALISVGAGNDYGHPASSTVDALEQDGDDVYRTDLDGTVLVGGTPGHVEVRSMR